MNITYYLNLQGRTLKLIKLSKILLYIIHFNFFSFFSFLVQGPVYTLQAPKKNYNTTVQIITSMLFFFFMINFLLNKLIPVPLPFSFTPKKTKEKKRKEEYIIQQFPTSFSERPLHCFPKISASSHPNFPFRSFGPMGFHNLLSFHSNSRDNINN